MRHFTNNSPSRPKLPEWDEKQRRWLYQPGLAENATVIYSTYDMHLEYMLWITAGRPDGFVCETFAREDLAKYLAQQVPHIRAGDALWAELVEKAAPLRVCSQDIFGPDYRAKLETFVEIYITPAGVKPAKG